jgi:hypothetical protein
MTVNSAALKIIEECCMLGCDAIWVVLEPVFMRNMSPSIFRVEKIT